MSLETQEQMKNTNWPWSFGCSILKLLQWKVERSLPYMSHGVRALRVLPMEWINSHVLFQGIGARILVHVLQLFDAFRALFSWTTRLATVALE